VKLYYCLINKIYKKDDVFSILSEIVPSKTTQRKISLTELHRKESVIELEQENLSKQTELLKNIF
jgi:hypothetical protein